ncbi:MAG: hypothetical protein VX089_01155, partial [Pseudomonadota bacterium]|nr:hypothetical protein [Pseudomonadota bacterium]
MQKLNSFLHKTKITKDELSQEKVDIFNRLLNINNSFDAFYKYKTMPFGWHWLFFSHFQSLQKIGEDGHTKRGDFFPVFKGCKRMFAGAEILVLDEAFINSKVTKISQITEINNKSTNDKKAFYVTVENVFKIKNKNVLIEKKKIV